MINSISKRATFLFVSCYLFLSNVKISWCANIPLDYTLNGGSISVNDVQTTWPDIATIFNHDKFKIIANLSWTRIDPAVPSSNVLKWVTSIDGKNIDDGEFSLASSMNLPSKIDVGEDFVSFRGRHTITVTLYLDNTVKEFTRQYQSYPSGVSIIPLVIVVLLSMKSHSPHLAMSSGILIGSFIITGSIREGFVLALTGFIVGALSNPKNTSVFVFVAAFSGLIALMEKSGGVDGFAKLLSRYVTKSRGGQAIVFLSGCLFCIDSYSSILTVGGLWIPVTDRLFISREKLAFLVDSTCAPIISLAPFSKWISFITHLIQLELDAIARYKNIGGEVPDGLPETGMEVFLQTIKYRYYPIFMLMFIAVLIISSRDFGPMLIAERKVFVYGRTDGGDGRSRRDKTERLNKPHYDTPRLWYNMAIPILLLIFFFLFGLFTGDADSSQNLTLINLITTTNSSDIILIGVIATGLCMLPFYSLQFVQDGMLYFPTFSVLKRVWIYHYYPPTTRMEENEYPRQLITFDEFRSTFVFGMRRVSSFFVILTLAWSIADMVEKIGTNRYFAMMITKHIDLRILPTISYIISCLISLATGTSFGTMTIMIALVTKGTWIKSGGDLDIFYGTIAGVLSGSIFGDHVSPISDTTILSSYACRCQHMAHVKTQAPYALVPGFLAIICGTLPVGYKLYSSVIGLVVGFICTVLVVFLMGVKLIAKGGRFDFCTEFSMIFFTRPTLIELKRATAYVDSSY